MRKQLTLIFLSMIISTNCFASVLSYQKDPCTSMSGFWTGDFTEYKKNCGCTAYYQVRQSNEDVAFDLMQYNCTADCDVPPDFQGSCRGAWFTSKFDGHFDGLVGENVIMLENGNYKLKLFR